MTRRAVLRLPSAVLAVLLLFLVACQGQGDDGGQQVATTVAATTTTQPDPGEAGCKQFGGDAFEAAELMLISRDERIVDAVKEWQDANREEPEGAISGRAVRAVSEIIAACRAAGYDV